MSKPSKKSSPPPAAPPTKPRSRRTLIAIGGVALAGVVIAAVVFTQPDRVPAEAPAQAAAVPVEPVAAPPATPTAPATQPAVALGPHPQTKFPPLRLPAYAPARSPEVITAAYKFAAEHPEVLSYVPCFCGCERMGHHGNEDCFVQKRGANGDVTEWTEHGMECTVCLDVAQQAMQMYASGASVRDIRSAVERKWATQSAQNHAHTPTPEPPKN